MPKAFAIEPRIANELRALGHFVTPPRSRPIQVRHGSVHSVPHSRNSIILSVSALDWPVKTPLAAMPSS
jgi:hypothetical protein